MFIIGQRWVSESEPELGLGVVTDIGDRDVCIQFGAGEEMRRYAVESAPVRRVIFAAGDTVATRDDTEITVDEVIDDAGLITYVAGATRMAEAALSDRITFNQPLDSSRRARTITRPIIPNSRSDPSSTYQRPGLSCKRINSPGCSSCSGTRGAAEPA